VFYLLLSAYLSLNILGGLLMVCAFIVLFLANIVFLCESLKFILAARATFQRSSRHGIPNNIEHFAALQRARKAAKKKRKPKTSLPKREVESVILSAQWF